MANYETELKDLREKNNELVQKVQYWKMTAAQRENEKLELMKELNDLRLKLSRVRSGGAAHARKLDAALQSASEEALSHLVQASSAVARTLELAKTYMQDRQELETALPRWSSLSNTPSSEKVNRVPPMLIGGRLIQPVVSLSRNLQSNNSRTVSRSPNQQNRSASERAVPMHMLQDVYIPLTRIDAAELQGTNAEADMEINNADNSTEDLALDDSSDQIMEETENLSEAEDFEESRRLDAVAEDMEPEDAETPPRPQSENPLEGPSWLLDRPSSKKKSKSLVNLEPDSTTEFEDNARTSGSSRTSALVEQRSQSALGASAGPGPSACEFTPTVRRRKRTSSPPPTPSPQQPRYSPRPARRYSNNGRILKVLVAKMRLDDEDFAGGDASPPKRPNTEDKPLKPQLVAPKSPKHQARDTPGPSRDTPGLSRDTRDGSPGRSCRDGSPNKRARDISPTKRLMRFDAPSPNGSTDSRVIVSETILNQSEPCSSKQRTQHRTEHRTDSRENRISRPNPSNHENNHTDRDNHNVDRGNHSNIDTDDHSNIGRESQNVTKRSNHSSGPSTHNRAERNSQNHSRQDNNNHTGGDNHTGRNNHTRETASVDNQSRDSDSSGSELAGEGRTRRPRKAVVYKEKPLNRKLRR